MFTKLNNEQIEAYMTKLYILCCLITRPKSGGGEGGAYSRRGAYFKFLPIGGALIRRGRSFQGAANSKIYGTSSTLESNTLVTFY